MARPVTCFVGSVSSFNVQRLVANLGWMLDGLDALHLLTTDPEAFGAEAVAPFEVFGADRPSSLRGAIGALREYLRSHEPAVLAQLTHPPTHGMLLGLAGLRDTTPVVYRYSGDRFREWRVARGRERVTGFAIGTVLGRVPLRLADQFVVLGPTGKSRLVSRGVAPGTISVLPPSVDATRFLNPAEHHPLDVPDDRAVALYVGRLSHLKGIETLEATIPAILDRRPALQFVFVGPQERGVSVPTGLRDHLTFSGAVRPAAMPSLYQQADVLVHPSLTDGVPRAVLEALAAGVPVVARDVGDVASATANTFETDGEFIDLVSRFDALALDDVEPFTRERLRPAYREFFQSFR